MRSCKVFLVCLALVLLVSFASAAEERFPGKPITIINPLPAGGPTDIVVRLLAEKAGKVAGQPVIVANKPGGTFIVGATEIQKARPDGYTIGYLPPSAIFTVPQTEEVPYDPFKDFKPIITYGEMSWGVVVKADSPYKTWKDLVSAARTGKVRFGHSGPMSLNGVVVNLMAKDSGISFINIPYKGSPEFQTALLGGHLDLVSGDFSYSFIEAGKTRVVVMLSDTRSPLYPNVPCMKELGFDYPVPVPFILLGPKGLPEPIRGKLEEIFTTAAKDPEYVKGVTDIRLLATYRSSGETARYMRTNFDRVGEMLRKAGLKK